MIYRRWKRPVHVATALVCLVIVATFSARCAQFRPRVFTSSDGTPSTASKITSTSSGPASTLSHDCPTSLPRTPFIPNTHGKFDWRQVKVHNPVETYIELPVGPPSSLPRIQHEFAEELEQSTVKRVLRQTAVKSTFERCWSSYKAKAWKEDEVAPISGASKDTFGGWGATLIDSLDTLWIMDMKDDFEEAVNAAVEIDFGPRGTGDVSMFELTIRHLGGLIAAYDISGCKSPRLLQKAVEVGDMVYASFDTPSRMPVTRWNPQKAADGKQQLPADSGIIAEMASASLELTRLSQLTGDMRYFDAISRVSNVLDEQQGRTKLPGMWPIGVDVRTPSLMSGTQFGMGAMADSAYEYLPKMYQLLAGVGGAGAQYHRMYEWAMGTAINHTLFRPMVEDKADILVSTNYEHGKKGSGGQHLACFAGGMLGLGGRLTNNDTHVDIGRKLTDGCTWAYAHAPVGIMPEMYDMPVCPDLSECSYTRPPGSVPFSSVGDGRYVLRPETIESIFYMYRITGYLKYQDEAWDMFQAIEKHSSTEFGNAALRNVMIDPPEKEDSMESFWMAETLKYFYLVFSEPGMISLDEWVFNTEAHPFRVPRP
ncbi:glycoside hydrolase family 47 protein [Plenodomus tracheiphilus IPT5]|uniref:alpha-1,2-Mannosidase n=1 Tax=Plenodomus tracheiphilus IPT5 TaxID=1408161 RepID=A0A6A7AM91_9PLEO|nr:glycoside hydrolase family 47 protein [Plenodomus tracheiphilus IPT5]